MCMTGRVRPGGLWLGGKQGQSPVSALLPPRDGAPSPANVGAAVCAVPALGPVGIAPLAPEPTCLPPALKSHRVDRRSCRACSRPQSTLQHGGFTGWTAQKGTHPAEPLPTSCLPSLQQSERLCAAEWRGGWHERLCPVHITSSRGSRR